jgi:hypothetical protein
MRAIVDYLDSSGIQRVKELIHTDAEIGALVPDHFVPYMETVYDATKDYGVDITAGVTQHQPHIHAGNFDLEQPDKATLLDIQVADNPEFTDPITFFGENRPIAHFGQTYHARARWHYQSGEEVIPATDDIPEHVVQVYSQTEWSPVVIWYVPDTWKYVDAQFTPPSLEWLRNRVKSKLAETRYRAETSPLKIGDLSIPMDDDSRVIIHQVMDALEQEYSETVQFKIGASFITLDVEQFRQIFTAMFTYIQACFTVEAQHSELLDAADTADEVAQYDFSVDWPSTEIA